MLDDRPEMKDKVPATHPVIAWLVDGFNGERIGQRVYWNANSPQSGRTAEHASPYGSYPPYISISGGTETTAIDKWTSVVYEMFNLENSPDFDDLVAKAARRSIDAGDFADQCVELEFKALQRTHDFFEKHPLLSADHGRDKFYHWATSELGTFEEYKTAFDVTGVDALNSNFEYFKEYYTKTLPPYAESHDAAKNVGEVEKEVGSRESKK